ncbi:MAG: hypothetical protein P8Y23_17100 [Candidatus Lokiarchaeota archaeon]
MAGLNHHIEIMLKRRTIDVPNPFDEEPILLLIISKSGIPIFTQSFIKDKIFEDHVFGGFFTALNSFINNVFSEGLDRASFGEYTLLMKDLKPFLLCYIYKGQSYSAQNRIEAFIEELHRQEWDVLGKSSSLNGMSNHDEVIGLNSIVTKIFSEKCIPSMELT